MLTKQLLFLFWTLIPIASLCQSSKQPKGKSKTEQWIQKHDIPVNSPTTPVGYATMETCEGKPMFRKDSGEHILLISYGGSASVAFEDFKEMSQKKDFNTFYYVGYVQDKGSVLVHTMRKRECIWRNDTLYLLDQSNDSFEQAHSKILKAYTSKNISSSEFKKQMDQLDPRNYPETPRYKVIYYAGLFEDSNMVQLPIELNFRQEQITLIKKWEESNTTFLEIDIETNTYLRFVFSEDLKRLEFNSCNE